MRRVALQRVAGRLLDVQPHTKIDRGVYWNVCADFLRGGRGARGYPVGDSWYRREWTTDGSSGHRTRACDHGFVVGEYLGVRLATCRGDCVFLDEKQIALG